jgi:hypothetical protein
MITRQRLEEIVMDSARQARQEMVETAGSFRQRALIFDKRNGVHMIVLEDVLHGSKMRGLLTVFAAAFGGAEVIVVQSDARFEGVKPSSQREKEIEQAAEQGRYIIADNPQARETLMTAGRCQTCTAACFDSYRREPTGLVFDDPEPMLWDGRVDIHLIPNIWEPVN